MNFIILFIVCLYVQSAQVFGITINDLPPIYDMDNFTECIKNNDKVCEIDVYLHPVVLSDAWKLIQHTKNQSHLYNHQNLKRVVCLPKNKENYAISYFKNIFNDKYKHLQLNTTVKDISCKKEIENDTFDFIFLYCFIVYLIFIIFATLFHWTFNNQNILNDYKYITIFSLIYNWNNLSSNTRKFKFIDGLRTLTMLQVIICHIQLGYMFSFVKNTDYMENVFVLPHTRFLFGIFFFTVQIYFVLSAWFLAEHVNKTIEKDGKFLFTSALKLFTKRIIRLLPCLLLMTMFHKSKWLLKLNNGPFSKAATTDYEICSNRWWATLFLINNLFFIPRDMCILGTWYLSVDAQLYGISLLLFYLISKYKLKIQKSLVTIFIGTTILYFIILYICNIDNYMIMGPKEFQFDAKFASFQKITTYFSVLSNSGSYMMGLIFGTLFIQNKNNHFFNTIIKKCLWYISINFPTLLIYALVNIVTIEGFFGVLITSIIKPLFSFGICMMILGMQENMGGFLKQIFECRLLVFLANFAYTTYLYHFITILVRFVAIQEPIEVSNSEMGITICKYICISFLVGGIMHMLVEKPFLNLQKMVESNHWKKLTKKS